MHAHPEVSAYPACEQAIIHIVDAVLLPAQSVLDSAGARAPAPAAYAPA
jgi:hypothetical protein